MLAEGRSWPRELLGAFRLTDAHAITAAVSPDGRWLAYGMVDEAGGGIKLAITPFDGGPPVKVFDGPPTGMDNVGWTPDGSAVTYISIPTAKMWIQPVDGGAARELLDFKSGTLWWFDWSRDGNLLCSRGEYTTDVVLISNLK